MRWARFIFGSYLFLLATLFPSGLDAQAENHKSRVAGHITALLPEDHILRETQTVPAARDMALLWRDVVKTEPGGRYELNSPMAPF